MTTKNNTMLKSNTVDKKIESYDVYDGRGKDFIGTFDSIPAVATKFKVSEDTVTHALRNNRTFVGYQIIPGGSKPKKMKSRSKKVLLWAKDGSHVIKEFPSIVAASAELNLPQPAVSAMLARENVTYNASYYLRLEGDKPRNLYLGHQVHKYNMDGQELGVYNTFEESFDSENLDFNVVKKNYKSSVKTKYVLDGFQFIKEPHLDQLNVISKYLLTNVTTGVQLLYSTLAEVANLLDCSREWVRQAIKKQKVIGGYRITKLTGDEALRMLNSTNNKQEVTAKDTL